jgi:hypothetical protein
MLYGSLYHIMAIVVFSVFRVGSHLLPQSYDHFLFNFTNLALCPDFQGSQLKVNVIMMTGCNILSETILHFFSHVVYTKT